MTAAHENKGKIQDKTGGGRKEIERRGKKETGDVRQGIGEEIARR